MRLFEVTYTLFGLTKVSSQWAITNTVALARIIASLSRRDKLSFKLVCISLV